MPTQAAQWMRSNRRKWLSRAMNTGVIGAIIEVVEAVVTRSPSMKRTW